MSYQFFSSVSGRVFTGIVQGFGKVLALEKKAACLRYTLELDPALSEGIFLGASVAVDGVCQTLVQIQHEKKGNQLSFEAIPETLAKTTLGNLSLGQLVHIERSLKVGDELGGHQLFGHISSTLAIKAIERSPENSVAFIVEGTKEHSLYLLPKGLIALDGVSLTLGEVGEDFFKVYLIPHTLEHTTFKNKKVGDLLNVEFDYQSQLIVRTVQSMLKELKF